MEKRYCMGAKFKYGPETYILARTVNNWNKSIFHFQLISVNDGNRYSNTVITRIDSNENLSITEAEMKQLLEMFDDDSVNLFLNGEVKPNETI